MSDKGKLDIMLGTGSFKKRYIGADQNVERAVQIYRWNNRLAGAFHAQLSHLEVLSVTQ